MKKVVIVPRYIETIVVYKDKESEEALSHTNYEFDERGECELVMEFYDGIAYDVEGSGLVMTYPKAEKVQAHTILQNCIVAYTGIDDDIIGQFDIALRYGKLEWRKEEVDPEYWQDKLDPEDFDDGPDDKEMFETEDDVRAFLTDVIRVIGWAFNPDDSMCTYVNKDTDEYIYTQDEAKELDKLMDEAYDFCNEHGIDIYELSDEICKKLHGNLFDDDPEEDDEPEGAPDDYIALITKAANDITKASLQIAAMFSK